MLVRRIIFTGELFNQMQMSGPEKNSGQRTEDSENFNSLSDFSNLLASILELQSCLDASRSGFN